MVCPRAGAGRIAIVACVAWIVALEGRISGGGAPWGRFEILAFHQRDSCCARRGLKRGPTPGGTYVDRLDLTTHLQPGENAVAVRVWYFGRDGFSHKDSGCPGLRPQPADLSAFDIVTPTPLGPLKTTFRKTANGAGSYVIESPDGCPIEWDLTALLLPKNARLCANGERFGAARTGQAPGGHLRLEWKP